MPVLKKSGYSIQKKRIPEDISLPNLNSTKVDTFFFTGDDTTKSFTVPRPFRIGYEFVYVNQSLVNRGIDYQVIGNDTIQFSLPPKNGDLIVVNILGSFNVADVYSRYEIDEGNVLIGGLNHVKNDLLNLIKQVDGLGSGLDADLVRGLPADFSSSLTSSGYQKLPNGLIIQWGISPPTSIGTTTVITLPISFPNSPLIGLATNKGSGESTSVGIIDLTTTSISLYIPTDDTASGRIYYWIAIGY